jgi:arginyl-tRNA synthetase
VITGDIGAELACAVRAAVAAGELPPAAQGREDAAGTWRPAPRGMGGAPGTYASTLPFLLAEATGLDAAPVASVLAARLARTEWISAASVTGDGYLTVAVTGDALAALAIRVALEGDSGAQSTALCGVRRPAPPGTDLAGTDLAGTDLAGTDLASASTWTQAWQLARATAAGRLAAAAGADVTVKTDTERLAGPGPVAAAGPGGRMAAEPGPAAAPGPGPGPGPGPVAAAVAFAGADAIRYALLRHRTGGGGRIDAGSSVRHVPGNPYFDVCFAHADAAAMLRWAADLGLQRGAPGEFVPGLLSHPAERELLDVISWLPERVAAAARRSQPQSFTRYLEDLARAYLACRESCPALPFLGRAAPRSPAAIGARLWLASAAGAALGAGLRLLGVGAPERV